MSTRFGGKTVRDTYLSKVRWLVGCLVSLIACLGCGVLYLALASADSKEVVAQAPAASELNKYAEMVDLLVAVERIEQGEPFMQAAFKVQQYPSNQIPATALVASQASSLHGKVASRMLHPGFPLAAEDFTAARTNNALNIPDGFRGITLYTDQREIVDGYATPNSRVDLLLTYKERGTTKVATIVRFAKIVAVDGNNNPTDGRANVARNGATVTLAVSEEDSRIIELARSEGKISLVLLGATATPQYREGERNPEPITLARVLNGPSEAPVANVDGRISFTDIYTGEVISYELAGNDWHRAIKHKE